MPPLKLFNLQSHAIDFQCKVYTTLLCTAYNPLYLFNASAVDFYPVAYTLSYNLPDREKNKNSYYFRSKVWFNQSHPIETEEHKPLWSYPCKIIVHIKL